jgi:hypothetical protein
MGSVPRSAARGEEDHGADNCQQRRQMKPKRHGAESRYLPANLQPLMAHLHSKVPNVGVNPIESGIDRDEPLIHGVEALIHSLKTPIHGVEPGVDVTGQIVEALVGPSGAFHT